MSEPHPTTTPDEQTGSSVITTDEDGAYLLTAPVSGTRPDTVTLRIDGTEYTFGGYDGVHRDSAVLPSVLRYEECWVKAEGDG